MKRSLLVALPIGLAMIAFGAVQFLTHTPDPARRLDFAEFLVGADLVHDLVLAPVVAVAGALILRSLPARWRAPVRFGLVASAVAMLLALPGLAHTAADAHNPTVQARDYGPALAFVLGTVWLIAAVWIGARVRRGRARPT